MGNGKKRLKKGGKPNKISGESIKERACLNSDNQYPAISFRYLTTNSRYSFKAFNKNHETFIDACKAITETSYANRKRGRVNHGWETINAKYLSFSPKEYKLSGDSKVWSIRFDNQNKRVIAIKDGKCATLYIIGIDHDFNAYDHGN